MFSENQKFGSQVIRASLCKWREGIKGKVITMRWKECGIWSRQT